VRPDFSKRSQEDLEQAFKTTGFFVQSQKHQELLPALVDRHSGEVPKTMESLTELGGVGRRQPMLCWASDSRKCRYRRNTTWLGFPSGWV